MDKLLEVSYIKPQAFMIDSCTRLSSTLIVKFMRDALTDVLGDAVHNITMHYLRCGAAKSVVGNQNRALSLI